MTPTPKNKPSKADRQATIHELLQERMRLAIRHTLITVLEEEVEGFIQAALYQRTPSRRDYRNGHYERHLGTSLGELEDLPVPRAPVRGFAPSCLNAINDAKANWMS